MATIINIINNRGNMRYKLNKNALLFRKLNPESNIPSFDQEAIDTIIKYNKGKKLENFLTSLDIIQKSLQAGGWLPRGSVSSGKISSIGIKIDQGDRETYYPYEEGKKTKRTAFSELISNLKYLHPFKGSIEELNEALSQLTPQELKKFPRDYIIALVVFAEELDEARKFLDSGRKPPVITSIGLSPRVTTTLKEMNLDLDLPSVRLADIKFNLVQKRYADPKSPRFGELMFDRYGKPVMEKHYYVSWTPNITLGASRFAYGEKCEACGKTIPSGKFVAIEAFDKKSHRLVGMWLGQDCAKNIFGIKDEGIERN